jgi:hypothetical protein
LELTVSLALLLFASTSDELPAWGGPLDVAVAVALVVTAAWIWSRAMRRVDASSLRPAHIIAATVPALTLAAIWFYREQLDLNVLLPGLAWRTFLFLYSLPSCLTAWRQPISL